MAQISHLDVGDLWTPQATFTVGGVNTDPTNLTVKQQDPAGTETTLLNNVATSGLNSSSTPVAKTATGIYKLNPGISLTSSGYWHARFEGTGTAQAAEDHVVVADPSEFVSNGGIGARALVGLAETKDWLNINQVTTAEDLDIVAAINEVSDNFTYEAGGREFKVSGTNPQTRTFIVENIGHTEPWYVDGQWMGDRNLYNRRVFVGDMASAPTQVQIIDTDWATVLETVALADVTVLPTVRQSWQPIRWLEFQSDVTSLKPGMRVAVTGDYGFPAVPERVKQAVKDAVVERLDRDVEHYRQDFAPTQTGEAQNVITIGRSGPTIVSLPPRALSVAWSFRDQAIA